MSVAKDIETARKLIDPYLKVRQVGQYSEGAVYQKGMSCSFNETILCRSKSYDSSMADYWDIKGKNQCKQANNAGLWCDGSASIIMTTLMAEPTFGSSLTVVEQGNAKLHGHWWVIANLTEESPSYKGPFGDDAFTIDIWGALELKRRGNKVKTCVVSPARALYNCGKNNKLTIHCTVPGKKVSKKKKKRRFCYITTATCAALGLGDDCDALMLLRAFRDDVMLATPEGRRDVEEYYETASAIVEGIARRPDAEHIYMELYKGPIQRALDAIQGHDFEQAYAEYKAMVFSLKDQFLRS